jgi:hypothetical protein
MHPAVAELRRLVPPPAHPDGADGDWAACERELQLRLPEDYKEFISAYGSGTICGFFRNLEPLRLPAKMENDPARVVGKLGADLRLLG